MLNYQEYLNSKEWKIKSAKFKKNEPQCFVCNSGEKLQVHHINYDCLGKETSNDVIVLCDIHHRKVHFSRAGNFINNPKRNYGRADKMRKHYRKMQRRKNEKN